jgi:cell division septation protein DedD
MTEKDDFGFEEQPEPVDQDPGSALIEEESRRNLGESEAVEKRSPGRMFLLLVLLLALAGAAAYFFLGSPPVPETPPPAPPVRQPIALPPPPPVNTEEATVKTESVPPAPPSVEAPAVSAVKPEVAVKAEKAVKATVPAKAEETTARTEAPSPPPAGQVVAPAKVASPKAGPYFLQAGAFLLKANLREAEAQVRRLGYEPRVKSMRKTVPMTRLRVGAFFAEEGKAKLDSLKAVAPNAFLIRQGEYVLVYAGSYQDLDRARRAADHLYQQGIRVEEEPITAEVSLSLLSFGGFADRNAAEQAAVRARAAGLEAIVRKDP